MNADASIKLSKTQLPSLIIFLGCLSEKTLVPMLPTMTKAMEVMPIFLHKLLSSLKKLSKAEPSTVSDVLTKVWSFVVDLFEEAMFHLLCQSVNSSQQYIFTGRFGGIVNEVGRCCGSKDFGIVA